MQIEIENVSFCYKKKSPTVINDLSVTFESGKLYTIIGANGSGKTTLGKLILGLLKPDKGQIKIDGMNGKKLSAGKRAYTIGYLFQNPDLQLFAPTVMEELSFPFELTKQLNDGKKEEIKKLLREFKLEGMEDRYPLTMSGGEKQRLALATVMSRNVKFLILDEPTSSIDASGREFIENFVNDFVKNGGGAIVITHDEDFLCSLQNPILLRLTGGKFNENRPSC